MKKLMRILVLFFAAVPAGSVLANLYSEINYQLTPVLSEKVPFLKIEMEIKGQFRDKVAIDLPLNWAGIDYSGQIKNVKLENSSGNLELIKKDFFQAIIKSPETLCLTLSYEVHQKSGNPLDVHEAIIRQDLIHSPGFALFATPEGVNVNNKDKTIVTIKWQGLPAEWQTLSPYGMENTVKFTGNIYEFLHNIYGAGNLRIYPLPAYKNPGYLSLYGKFDKEDEEIMADLNEIISTQSAFFNDNDFSSYVVSLLEGEDPHLMGGTRLFNCFTAFLPHGLNKNYYYILFAHEHLHNWLGGKISRNGQEGEGDCWWSEGFTEYYARVLALRSGGLSLEEFIEELNQLLKAYYLSPALNEPNSRIKEDFWKNEDISKLPYNRGWMFAIYLNYLIKKNNCQNSLDKVMMDLWEAAKKHNTNFSPEHFQKILQNYIPTGISKEFALFIDQGHTIDLKDLAEILSLEKITLGAYYPGFDREIFRKEKIIKHLDKNSNAYKAGLREGDIILEWTTPNRDDPDQVLMFKTEEKVVHFKPEHSDKKEVYQFKPNLSEEEKRAIREFFGAE